MSIRVPILACLTSSLLACSTAAIEPVPIGVAPQVPSLSNPVVVIQMQRPGFDERREMQSGQFCHLGTTCLEMDPRPFEVCLLGSDRCSDKLEPLLVDGVIRRSTPQQQTKH